MADDKELYDLLSMLDRLEEVREDLEELEREGRSLDDQGVDEELRDEAGVLGVRTSADVERRIAELDAQVELRSDPPGGAAAEDEIAEGRGEIG